MAQNFYITTAIDYANGAPHLGHAYEKVLTDVIARHRRLMGDRVYFLTGTDEHGQKVQQSAHREGLDPQLFVDRVSGEFRQLCADLNISNDDFIRTSEPRHKRVVQQILQSLFDQGEIYFADYKGFYSVRQEQFLTERERNPDGSWPQEYGEVTEVVESNYYFKLSQYQEWLIDYIRSNEDFIFPRFRQKQVLEFLKEPLNDLCISRPVERLSWGIPMPFDERFVTYVWFDALINYASAVGRTMTEAGQWWPADYHVIGKDIMVPAHAIYWPIMLKAAGIPLPRHLLVHGFWMLAGGAKMSKSTGPVVRPLDLAEAFGPDSFRYFVIREMNVGQDSEFSQELFLTRYTSDLGNDLGNLVSRLLNMGHRYAGGEVPAQRVDEEPERELRTLWSGTRTRVLELFEGFQFHEGLDRSFAFIRGINRYAEQRQPWKLARSEEEADRDKVETALACMAEGLRLSAILLHPVMPTISARILGLLGSAEPESWLEGLEWSEVLRGNALGEKTILFPRPQEALETAPEA